MGGAIQLDSCSARLPANIVSHSGKIQLFCKLATFQYAFCLDFFRRRQDNIYPKFYSDLLQDFFGQSLKLKPPKPER